MTYLWVGLGGFLGVNARFVIARAFNERYGNAFPWGTMTVNISGSFLIGLILETLLVRQVENSVYRLALVVGFLGGYTTFSAFSLETVNLLQQGYWQRAAVYVIGSNALAVLACYIGILAGRQLA